jgi:hypothetical protein
MGTETAIPLQLIQLICNQIKRKKIMLEEDLAEFALYSG